MFGFGPEFIFKIPGLLLALTVHEYAHARAAVWLGDHTPKSEGRLTLNPIAHLDPFGLIMLCISNFGWAKPVNVNFYNLKDFRKGLFFVSLAGPFANFLMAFISLFLYYTIGFSDEVVKVLIASYQINLSLTLFNLLPIPPLDGSKILMSLFPQSQNSFWHTLEQYGTFILMALVFTHIIDPILNPLYKGLHMLIKFMVSTII